MTKLSPAAQAVLDAFRTSHTGQNRTANATMPAAVPRANHKPPGQCSACPDRGSPGAVPRPQTMAKTGTLTSRMEMRVDDSFIATVTELANLTQQSKAEVLGDALNLYYKAVKEYENGKGIVFQVIEQSQGSSKTTAEKTGKPLCASHAGQGCLAAALRAAADQVVPHEATAPWDELKCDYDGDHWEMRQWVRHQFLAIAAELEGQDQLTKGSD